MLRASLAAILAAVAAGAAIPAAAHGLGVHGAGFAAGLAHPVGGLDHLLAMVAVGLWAAQRGGPAVWALPAAFMAAMILGGVLGMAGLLLPGVEPAIAASVLMLGTLVSMTVRPPAPIGMAVVGTFAVFHGHAHGAEMPTATAPALYAIGFLLATGVLHAVGVAAVRAATTAFPSRGGRLVRAGGGAIAAAGVGLMAL